jgi:hypothetical protein
LKGRKRVADARLVYNFQGWGSVVGAHGAERVRRVGEQPLGEENSFIRVVLVVLGVVLVDLDMRPVLVRVAVVRVDLA